MRSILTLDPSFKVKRGEPNLKVLTTHLLLVLEVCNVKPTCRKSWAGNLLMWSDLTLGPLLQGQTIVPWLWWVVFRVDANLHRFSDVLGLVVIPLLFFLTAVLFLRPCFHGYCFRYLSPSILDWLFFSDILFKFFLALVTWYCFIFFFLLPLGPLKRLLGEATDSLDTPESMFWLILCVCVVVCVCGSFYGYIFSVQLRFFVCWVSFSFIRATNNV